jgi:hypothetical protein
MKGTLGNLGGKHLGKFSLFYGIASIALSGLLYTIERFIAVFQYGIDVVPVELNGSGSHPGEPNMPAVFDNFFVGFLLLLGLAFLGYGVYKLLKDG